MMARRNDEAGTFELLARLPHQIVTLVKIELDNAKREIATKAKRSGIGAVAIIVALFFVFFALEALVVAAIAAFALIWPVWLSALVVAFGLLLLAGMAILGGILLIKRNVPAPKGAISRVEGDLEAMSQVRFNNDGGSADDPLPQPGGKGNWR